MGKHIRQLLICVICIMLVGCGSDPSIGYISINGNQVLDREVMLYLVKTYDDFQQLGGEDVWQIEDFSGGKSADDVAKQGAIDNLIKVKILKLRAEDSGLTISAEEEAKILASANAYYGTLAEGFVKAYDIREEDVQQVFVENYFADQVELLTMSSYTPKSDEVKAYMLNNQEYNQLYEADTQDLLTTYQVHHIVVYTHEKDIDGNWTEKTQEQLDEAISRFDEAYEALENGDDFLTVTKKYSENKYFETQPDGLRLSKAQLPDPLRDAIDSLEVGSYCTPVRGDYGYHTFLLLSKNIPTSDEIQDYNAKFLEWEKALEEEAVLAMKKSVFEDQYAKWRSSTEISFTQEWTKLDFLEAVNTLIE